MILSRASLEKGIHSLLIYDRVSLVIELHIINGAKIPSLLDNVLQS
jgi:hypothetical protein